MTILHNLSTRKNINIHISKLILILIGLLLTFVWPIIIAIPLGPHVVFCDIAGYPCADRWGLSDALALGPAIIGAIILGLGCIYTLRMDRSIKTLIFIALSVFFAFVSYWSLLVWWYIESLISSLH